MLVYLLFRVLFFPFHFLPHSALRAVAKALSLFGYYFAPSLRKKTECNLAFASDLKLNKIEKKQLVQKSFYSLALTAMEYFYFNYFSKRLLRFVHVINKESFIDSITKEKNFIFLSSHSANWELPLLITSYFYKEAGQELAAIGRPIKNLYLYRWILRFRERFGCVMIDRSKALKEARPFLRKGGSLGIAADQALPESPYSYPFLGSRAWTSSAPALLALQTKTPIIIVKQRRLKKGLEIEFSDPIYPDYTVSLKKSVVKLMDQCMHLVENEIKQHPGDWLWLHRRWKQKISPHVRSGYRFDSVLFVLPQQAESWFPQVYKVFRHLYPYAWCTILHPQGMQISLENAKYVEYSNLCDRSNDDETIQVLFDYTNSAFLKKVYGCKWVNQARLMKLAKKFRPQLFHKELSPALLFAAAIGQEESILLAQED